MELFLWQQSGGCGTDIYLQIIIVCVMAYFARCSGFRDDEVQSVIEIVLLVIYIVRVKRTGYVMKVWDVNMIINNFTLCIEVFR